MHEPRGEELRRRVDVGELLSARARAPRRLLARADLSSATIAVVRGTTVIPRGAADAGVIAPIPGSPLGVALAVAGNPRYGASIRGYAGELRRPRGGAPRRRRRGASDRADRLPQLRQSRAIPSSLDEFVAAVDGLALAARELGLPFVSGNVSLYNESADGVGGAGVADRRVRRHDRRRFGYRHARLQSARVPRCSGSAAANSRSAAPCSRSSSDSRARLPRHRYDAERAAIGIVGGRASRAACCSPAAPSATAAC